jgi:hypothetical protein
MHFSSPAIFIGFDGFWAKNEEKWPKKGKK